MARVSLVFDDVGGSADATKGGNVLQREERVASVASPRMECFALCGRNTKLKSIKPLHLNVLPPSYIMSNK